MNPTNLKADSSSPGKTAAPRPVVALVEYVPAGDNTWRAVPQRPVSMVSITEAARATGKSRDNIYRLFKAGFIEGDHSSPGKIRVDLGSLQKHLAESAGPDFWTFERKQRYSLGLIE